MSLCGCTSCCSIKCEIGKTLPVEGCWSALAPCALANVLHELKDVHMQVTSSYRTRSMLTCWRTTTTGRMLLLPLSKM